MSPPNDKQLYLDATQEVDRGTPDPALWGQDNDSTTILVVPQPF